MDVGDGLVPSATPAANGHGVSADAFNLGAERDEKLGEVLNVWLAGSVAEHSGTGCCGGSDQRVLGGGDARLVEENIRPPEAVDAHVDHLAVGEAGAELLEGEEMCIESAPTNDVAARRRKRHLPTAREERRSEKDRRPDLRAQRRIEVRRPESLA